MGGSHGHTPVLAREVCDAFDGALAPANATPAGVFVDATCGLGGHSAAVLSRFAPRSVVAIDRDPAALEQARARLPGHVAFVHARFSTLRQALREQEIASVAAVVADLGVSSLQLDSGPRGFSFRAAAPLDMRMDPSTGPTAAEFLAVVGVADLARILRDYGEEPDAKRIAAAVVAARPGTTDALASTVARAMSHRQRRKLGARIHPATKTFQAIRIHINRELEELDRLLEDAPAVLATGGRLAIITFHSLEDRRVKRRFRALSQPPEPPAALPIRASELPPPNFVIPRGYAQGVTPSAEEIDTNPRARSARLRVLQRAVDEAA